MFTTTRSTRLAALTAALTLPLAFAACSGTTAMPANQPTMAPMTSAPMTSEPMTSAPMTTSPSMSPSMAATPFGAACAAVPETGKGSFDGMSQDPVATAASNNPLLSTLVTAVGKAGLVDTLNNAEGITVFAPTNDAFAKIDPATLKKVLADKKMLTAILTAHVVGERLDAGNVAGEHDSLNPDQPVTVAGSGEEFTVNGSAKVLCGDVQTANATVYLIDTVLLPAS
jgi:uncharacterized surface protein with fasciclin (FAS1) repeats